MAAKRISYGLVMYRYGNQGLEILISHPGGPKYAKKDAGHWTIPKGGKDPHESELEAALREFKEETGLKVPENSMFIDLGSIVQKGGKHVRAWGVGCPWDPLPEPESQLVSVEWPPGSLQWMEVPEMDQIEFFPRDKACELVKQSQVPLLERLEDALRV